MVVLVSQTTDEESTDGRYEELEEEINILNKLIMDKDNELASQGKFRNSRIRVKSSSTAKRKTPATV